MTATKKESLEKEVPRKPSPDAKLELDDDKQANGDGSKSNNSKIHSFIIQKSFMNSSLMQSSLMDKEGNEDFNV